MEAQVEKRRFPIRVGEKIFQPNEQQASNHAWMNALYEARGREITFCLCRGGIPLTPRLLPRQPQTMSPNPACREQSKHEHDEQCKHFSQEGPAEVNAINGLPVEEMQDGQYLVHLATSMHPSGGGTGASPQDLPRRERVKTSRQLATEITVLRTLWRASGLNVYKTKSRDWFSAVLQIIRGAGQMLLDKQGSEKLLDFLLIGAKGNYERAEEHNMRVLENAEKNKTRLFAVGRLAKLTLGKSWQKLHLRDDYKLPLIGVDWKHFQGALEANPYLKSMISDEGNVEGQDTEIIVCACIELGGGLWCKTVSLAATPVAKNLIPVENGDELALLQYLTKEKREFLKLIYLNRGNSVGKNSAPPEGFMLLDTQPTKPRVYLGVQARREKSAKLNEADAANRLFWTPGAGAAPALPARYPN
jgi:hypothetical protein